MRNYRAERFPGSGPFTIRRLRIFIILLIYIYNIYSPENILYDVMREEKSNKRAEVDSKNNLVPNIQY